jgi:glycosyltransferase involved in cell wall biosynthesis
MQLDVLIATYERPALLARALRSLLSAPAPDTLTVRITVIQNDADAATSRVIAEFVARYPDRVTWLCEPRPGKSRALNTGVRHITGDLVGFIDDDEEIAEQWYLTIARTFADPGVDFIGGPCLLRWGAIPPAWMPDSFNGVVGFVDDGDQVMVFGQDAPGMLMGGNAVIRRRTLLRAGEFSPALGPQAGQRLLSAEDEDLYSRLLRIGAHGLYIPSLKIYHFVPPHRLTKSYYRRWTFWQAVSRSIIDGLRPFPVARIGRVPRYIYGSAARALLASVRSLRDDPAVQFARELQWWRLAGFVYGSYWYRKESS